MLNMKKTELNLKKTTFGGADNVESHLFQSVIKDKLTQIMEWYRDD